MLSYKKSSNQSGFTLLEIVVVFAIMAIISTYMIGNVAVKSRQRARDTQRKTALANIAKALEIYINDYGQYPAANSAGQIIGCGSGPVACAWGTSWSDTNGTIYMSELPDDDRDNLDFYYSSDGTAWQLYAFLEATDDPVLNGPFTGISCGDEVCNYGVSSGNTTPGATL